MSQKISRLVLPISLVVMTFVAYLPAILWGGYIWDDDVHLTQNPLIFAANGLGAIWSKTTWRFQFYPLTFTTFWIQYRLHGLDPHFFHASNVLLHAANALLLWQLLRRLGVRGAFWIAAVFALHPLNVESVAWVTERKNVLMGFFYLLATLAYVRFENLSRDTNAVSPPVGRHWIFYTLAAVAFLASLLSKTVGCTFPAAMAILIWWKRGRVTWREWVPLVPLLIVGLGFARWTSYVETTVIGSSGSAWNYSAMERVLIAGRAIWFYVGKLLLPTNLMFSYPLWNVRGAPFWEYAAPAGVFAGVAILWWLRARSGRGVLAAVLLFLVTLSPALGFANIYTMIYSLVADHYVYVSSMAFAALAVQLFVMPVTHPAGNFRPLAVLRSVALPCVVGVLGILTWQRCFVYQSEEILWRDTLEKNPHSWLAMTEVGIAMRHHGEAAAAMAEFQEALRVNPHCVQAMNEMGTVLADQGRMEEAAPWLERVIQEDPKESKAYGNLAIIRTREGRIADAAGLYQTAVAIDPYNVDARVDYGQLLANAHRFGEAAALFQQAIALAPADAAIHLSLGECLAESGQVRAALGEFEEAVRLRPGWREAQQDVARAQSFLAQPH
jgi:Tfp pilus assembly protein PilF